MLCPPSPQCRTSNQKCPPPPAACSADGVIFMTALSMVVGGVLQHSPYLAEAGQPASIMEPSSPTGMPLPLPRCRCPAAADPWQLFCCS
jgi:hypothetical protein